MYESDKSLRELLAEARAIRLATEQGAINYDEAKERVKATLEKVNVVGERIAKKYGRKHRKITFENLGRNF